MNTQQPRTIAIVGAGVIGMSWARLAHRHGWQVVITDPRPDLGELVESEFGVGQRVSWTAELADAVHEADLVQENGPERLPVKQQIFTEILRAAPADAVLATSSSSITASLIAAGLGRAERIIVGHPFNPPELMPLVEVLPGNKTDESTVTRAVALYTELDRVPVVIRKEMPGFVANRLQMALTAEAIYLVESGVVDVKELDAIVQNSFGLRWSTIGLFEAMALGGGASGVRHLFAGLGTEVGKIEFGRPSTDPAVRGKLIEDIESAYGTGEQNFQRLVTKRDRKTTAVLEALTKADDQPAVYTSPNA
ncbi:3-hydroxyacyl-CoA dehydrogenase NAD-binding domain-containing protein [Nocardia altamirensis]|uniref:3-hydroxyacyl-CoA dehydrogenase NAD-binding domain-containing protein n=1 Tax=Nocardia altamirensis TaxID=472158 RepID=UPI00084053BD|nr:3-hydroxyacyl-CoA dehydrogenase NAD-binding domain-containing protein [Nocardia altamirensis]